MKKYLLILLTVLALSSCQKDDEDLSRTGEKPSITEVKFSNAMTGSISHVRVELVLSIPEKGSVLRLDALRNTTRINAVLDKPESGTHVFTDNGASWPGATPAYYTFIFVSKDGTETISTQYQVK